MSKFDSARDELLYRMTLDGWANASNGDVESPSGFFARISNSRSELAEIRDAFPTETEDVSDSDMVGHFLCQENELGFWFVTQYENPRDLERAYQILERLYEEWLD